MVVDKIKEFLSLDEDIIISPELLETYKEDMASALIDQCYSKNDDKIGLRLSGIGYCLRKQAFNIHGFPKCRKLTPRAKMTFLQGDILEAVTVILAKSAGVDLSDEQKTVTINGVDGHIDGIVTIDGVRYIFECKSMNNRRWLGAKKDGITDSGYLAQGHSYAVAEGCVGVIWVCVNKDTGQMFEDIQETNPAIIQDVVNNINMLRESKSPFEFNQHPYEEETWYKNPTGNKILKYPCTYCDFTVSCWGEATIMYRGKATKQYGGKVHEGKWTANGKFEKL